MTTDEELRKALVAWLRWHAPSAQELERAPAEYRPLLDAMSRASGVQAVAQLASAIEKGAAESAYQEGHRAGVERAADVVDGCARNVPAAVRVFLTGAAETVRALLEEKEVRGG